MNKGLPPFLYGEIKAVPKRQPINLVTSAIVWAGVLMSASGFGLLADRIWETIQYGR